MGHSARTSLRRIGVGRNLLIWLAALVVGLLAIGAGAALSGSRAASAQSADFDATVSVKHAVIPVIAGDTLTVEARFRNISRADGPHDGEATFDLTIVVEPPSGSATRYSWDNEEFSLAEVRDFSKQHTFGQTGTYTVRAEIYDIDGQQSGWSAANRFDSDSETFTAYDPVTVQFSASEYTVDEDGGEVHITLTMSGSLPVEVGVRFSTLEYTALSRTDFSHTILLMRFASNSTRLTVPVRISDDYTVEPEETFQVKLEPTNSNPSYVTVSSSPATVTIRDNDEATVQFPTDQIRVNEDSGQVSVRVEVSSGGGRCAVASSFEVNISYSDPSGGLAPGETGPSSLTFDRCDRVRAFLADVANVTGDADVVFTLDSVTAADSGVASRIEIGDTSSVTVTVIDTDRLYVGRVSPTSGAATLNAGDSQTFTAIAARPGNNRASYEWTVDGQQVDSGTTSFTNEVQNSYTHTFPSTGTYNVRVEFTDSTGMTAFTSWTVEVVDSTMPTNRAPSVSRVSPSSSSITLTTGSSRTFTARATDVDSNITGYEWTLNGSGVGNSGTLTATGDVRRSHTHSFPSTGAYTVRAEFTDDDGATGSTSWRVVVAAPQPPPQITENSAPTVSRVSPATSTISLTKGDEQTFRVRATDSDGNLTKWKWDVDKHNSPFDSHHEPEQTFAPTTSTTTTFAHTFPDDGTYTVTATFTDSEGESGTAEWTVEVIDAPVSLTCGVEPVPGDSSLVAGKIVRVIAQVTAREDVTDVYVDFRASHPTRGLSDSARSDKVDIDEGETRGLLVPGVFIPGDGFIVECTVRDAGLAGFIDFLDRTLASRLSEPFSVGGYPLSSKEDVRAWLRECGPVDASFDTGATVGFTPKVTQVYDNTRDTFYKYKADIYVYMEGGRVWDFHTREKQGPSNPVATSQFELDSGSFAATEPGEYTYDCILSTREFHDTPFVSAITRLPTCLLGDPFTLTLCAIVFVFELSTLYEHEWSLSSNFCVGGYPHCPFDFTPKEEEITPTVVKVGEPVRLTFGMGGLNGAADHGGVSVSFPDLTDTGTGSSDYEYVSDRASVSTVSYTTGTSNVAYHRPGDTITTETGTTASAGYLLVESDDGSWPEDADRTLVLEVTPWEPGTLSVQYRYWLCLEGYDDCRRRPVSGGTDQQGWHVGVGTITVNAVPDRDELIEFHGETDGANWDDDTNWLSHEPLDDWYGVATGTDDRVTGLELSGNGLSGEIPAVTGDLTELQLLDLSDNGLRGEIPAELESLTKLRELELFRNGLSGEIPEGLGDLSALERLDLGENGLDGEIPTALGSLSKLQTLSLYDNDLARSIPTELGNLSSLTELDLSDNMLSGEIPMELGKLTSLEVLDLSENDLSGAIPPALGSLTNLEDVYLGGNNLDSGCIPASWRDLDNDDLNEVVLPFCDVALSALTISPGELSPEFDPGVSRYTAEVEQSPVTIAPVTGHGATFELLDGEGESIVDTDDTQAGHQVEVVFGGTAVTIEVTSQDGRDSHSYTIDVVLSGEPDAPTIASVTPGASSLEVSWVAPTDVRDDYITSYDLRHIDSSASDRADSNWTVLDDMWSSGLLSHTVRGLLAGTEYDVQVRAGTSAGSTEWSETVSGTPEEGECTTEGAADSPGQASDCETALEVLDALSGSGTSTLDWTSDNSVEDWDGVEVDPTTGRVTRVELDGEPSPGVQTAGLRTLIVRQTATSTADLLTGEIPPELGSLAELEYLSLADNLLGGEIPPELGRLSELTSLRLQGNELSGRIPPELAELSMLVELKLSGNDLTGCVPEGLHSIADNDLDELGLLVCGPSVELSVATTSVAVRIGTPIGVTATFGESVTGFTVDDIDVTNGSAANLSGTGSVYTFEVFPNAVGVVTVDMGSGAAAASDGDGNEAADRLTLGMPYDDDGDGAIGRDEVITAIGDYLFGRLLTRAQVIDLIGLYLFG